MPQLQQIRIPGRRGPSKSQIIGQAVAGAAGTLGRGIIGYGEQKERAERQAARDLREEKDDADRWGKMMIFAPNKQIREAGLELGRMRGIDKNFPKVFERFANLDIKFGKTSDEVLSIVGADWDRYIEGKSIEAEPKKKGAYDKTTAIIKHRARNPEEAREFRKSLNLDINLQYGIEPGKDTVDWDKFFGKEKPAPTVTGRDVGPNGEPVGEAVGLPEPADESVFAAEKRGLASLGRGALSRLGLDVEGRTIEKPETIAEVARAGPFGAFGRARPEPTGKVEADAPRPGGPQGGAFGIRGEDIGGGISPRATGLDIQGPPEPTRVAAPVVRPTRARPGGVDLSSLASGIAPPPVSQQRTLAPGGPVGGVPGIIGPRAEPGGIEAGIRPVGPSPVDAAEKRNESILMSAINDPVYKQLQKSIKAQRGKGDSWTVIMGRIKTILPGIYQQMNAGPVTNVEQLGEIYQETTEQGF